MRHDGLLWCLSSLLRLQIGHAVASMQAALDDTQRRQQDTDHRMAALHHDVHSPDAPIACLVSHIEALTQQLVGAGIAPVPAPQATSGMSPAPGPGTAPRKLLQGQLQWQAGAPQASPSRVPLHANGSDVRTAGRNLAPRAFAPFAADASQWQGASHAHLPQACQPENAARPEAPHDVASTAEAPVHASSTSAKPTAHADAGKCEQDPDTGRSSVHIGAMHGEQQSPEHIHHAQPELQHTIELPAGAEGSPVQAITPQLPTRVRTPAAKVQATPSLFPDTARTPNTSAPQQHSQARCQQAEEPVSTPTASQQSPISPLLSPRCRFIAPNAPCATPPLRPPPAGQQPRTAPVKPPPCAMSMLPHLKHKSPARQTHDVEQMPRSAPPGPGSNGAGSAPGAFAGLQHSSAAHAGNARQVASIPWVAEASGGAAPHVPEMRNAHSSQQHAVSSNAWPHGPMQHVPSSAGHDADQGSSASRYPRHSSQTQSSSAGEVAHQISGLSSNEGSVAPMENALTPTFFALHEPSLDQLPSQSEQCQHTASHIPAPPRRSATVSEGPADLLAQGTSYTGSSDWRTWDERHAQAERV